MAVQFEKITKAESWRIFDSAAQSLLKIDGATFVRRWDRGEYADSSEGDVVKVAMLRPSGR